MAKVKAFAAIRPQKELTERIAALPYDVYSRKEAKEQVKKEPFSFLRIDRAETNLGDEVDTYDPRVYEKAKEIYQSMREKGEFIREAIPSLYLYELTMDGRSQTGLVACASVDDYLNGTIRKHENTRREKEEDRVRHVDTLSAQTGPIFLAYREKRELVRIFEEVKREKEIFDFTREDGIRHRGWKISDPERIQRITMLFDQVGTVYIADGHHRAASAIRVAQKRRKETPSYTGEEEFNYFLSVLFPDTELRILDYNRVVKELGELSEEDFLLELGKKFMVKKEDGPVSPREKGEFGLFLGKQWYRLKAFDTIRSQDPVEGLDVALLQREVLAPLLGIQDPKTDTRIDFVGGIRGLKELERRVEDDCMAAFSLYPTSIGELFLVADAGQLMPPKSTWFEPKLLSGLFIHEF